MNLIPTCVNPQPTTAFVGHLWPSFRGWSRPNLFITKVTTAAERRHCGAEIFGSLDENTLIILLDIHHLRGYQSSTSTQLFGCDILWHVQSLSDWILCRINSTQGPWRSERRPGSRKHVLKSTSSQCHVHPFHAFRFPFSPSKWLKPWTHVSLPLRCS